MQLNDHITALELSWNRVRRAAISAGLDAEGLHQITDRDWNNLLARAIEAADRPDLWHEATAKRRAWRDDALARISDWRALTDMEETDE